MELGRVPSSSIGASSNGANNHNFHSSLEEATELEYLRNILFEFMMGRQTAVSGTTLKWFLITIDTEFMFSGTDTC